MILTLYCDAGSKGNPGYCYGSYLITSSDGKFRQERSRIKLDDFSTCNQAEYMILITALNQYREAVDLADSVNVYTDSKMMAQQLSGLWKTKNIQIKVLRDEALRKLSRFGVWKVSWVSRNEMVKRFGH
jgi:ribonuclease HI